MLEYDPKLAKPEHDEEEEEEDDDLSIFKFDHGGQVKPTSHPEIHQQEHQAAVLARDDNERNQWIDNDEGLYDWHRSSGMSRKDFIRQHRDDIDMAIDGVLGGDKPAHYLKYDQDTGDEAIRRHFGAEYCKHDLPYAQCDTCTRPQRRTSPGSGALEAPGHRGAPTEDEQERASYLRPKLQQAIDHLSTEMKNPHAEFAGLASMMAQDENLDRWSVSGTSTIRNILNGGAAKHWSLDLIEKTLPIVLDSYKNSAREFVGWASKTTYSGGKGCMHCGSSEHSSAQCPEEQKATNPVTVEAARAACVSCGRVWTQKATCSECGRRFCSDSNSCGRDDGSGSRNTACDLCWPSHGSQGYTGECPDCETSPPCRSASECERNERTNALVTAHQWGHHTPGRTLIDVVGYRDADDPRGSVVRTPSGPDPKCPLCPRTAGVRDWVHNKGMDMLGVEDCPNCLGAGDNCDTCNGLGTVPKEYNDMSTKPRSPDLRAVDPDEYKTHPGPYNRKGSKAFSGFRVQGDDMDTAHFMDWDDPRMRATGANDNPPDPPKSRKVKKIETPDERRRRLQKEHLRRTKDKVKKVDKVVDNVADKYIEFIKGGSGTNTWDLVDQVEAPTEVPRQFINDHAGEVDPGTRDSCKFCGEPMQDHTQWNPTHQSEASIRVADEDQCPTCKGDGMNEGNGYRCQDCGNWFTPPYDRTREVEHFRTSSFYDEPLGWLDTYEDNRESPVWDAAANRVSHVPSFDLAYHDMQSPMVGAVCKMCGQGGSSVLGAVRSYPDPADPVLSRVYAHEPHFQQYQASMAPPSPAPVPAAPAATTIQPGQPVVINVYANKDEQPGP